MLPLVFLMWKFLMLDDFHVCVCEYEFMASGRIVGMKCFGENRL